MMVPADSEEYLRALRAQPEPTKTKFTFGPMDNYGNRQLFVERGAEPMRRIVFAAMQLLRDVDWFLYKYGDDAECLTPEEIKEWTRGCIAP